eukprot:COSAG06_NODE_1666_length_8759_cov_35.338915_2_plen_87_part_00
MDLVDSVSLTKISRGIFQDRRVSLRARASLSVRGGLTQSTTAGAVFSSARTPGRGGVSGGCRRRCNHVRQDIGAGANPAGSAPADL